MPNKESAKKRLRQSTARRATNRRVKSEIRTRTRKLLDMDSAENAQTALSELYQLLDRAARRNVLPSNSAARQKARLARHVRSLTP